jgi:uncharacterized protein YbaR (Trm112 family)
MIDPKLLELLACPRCAERPPLEAKDDELVCTVCRFRYAVVDGIPRLLVDEARPPEHEER